MKFFSKLYIWLRGPKDEVANMKATEEEPLDICLSGKCNCGLTPPPTAITRDSMLKPKRKYTKRAKPKKATKKKVGRPKKVKND